MPSTVCPPLCALLCVPSTVYPPLCALLCVPSCLYSLLSTVPSIQCLPAALQCALISVSSSMSSQLCALHCVSSSLSVFFEVNGGIHSHLAVRGVGTIVRHNSEAAPSPRGENGDLSCCIQPVRWLLLACTSLAATACTSCVCCPSCVPWDRMQLSPYQLASLLFPASQFSSLHSLSPHSFFSSSPSY